MNNGDLISRKALEEALERTKIRLGFDKSRMFELIEQAPAVDAVEVVQGFFAGDVCFYGYAPENKSLVLVEIVKVLEDERGIAEIKVLKVFNDDSGNGWFDYLCKTGNTMNASFKYMRNITPERRSE